MLLNDAHCDSGDQPQTVPMQPRSDAQTTYHLIERHGYSSSRSNRLVGLAGTILVYLVVAGLFLFTISTTLVKVAPTSTLTVMDIKPSASPQDTPPKTEDAPKPLEKKETPQQPVRVEPVTIPISPMATPMPLPTVQPADPAPKEPETAAPRTAPAPPAPRVSSNGPETWEGRVLVQLNRYRRYPRLAEVRRQQGVPYIRFVMDRQGMVLSVALERSSGFSDLDREALALPTRAQPLPKPPDDKPGDSLELVVPVQFFLR